MMHSACRGVTLTLISTPPAGRDNELSVATREALLSAITTETRDGTTDHGTVGSELARHAIALKALAPTSPALSPSEAALLSEWLDRIADERPR
jgi:hypothetical protein